jgi:hypothetical protein
MKEPEMKNDEQGPMENLLDGLDQHSDALSFEELKGELQGRGIDIDPFVQQIEEMIAAHDKGERLAWMQVADERKESLRVAEMPESEWAHRQPSDVIAAFALFLQSKRALAFRNRGDLSVEDMAAILEADERLKRGEQRRQSGDE